MIVARRLERERGRPGAEPERRAVGLAEPALLQLQCRVGNAAVSRLLSRDPFEMRKADLTVKDPASQEAAFGAVETWFDALAGAARGSEAGTPPQSIAELVFIASELTYTGDDGKQAKVGERLKPAALELWLRGRAKTLGIELLDHRDPGDARGIGAEAAAMLANLGRVPTDVTFGGDADHITISLAGKVTGEAKVGDVKLEGEASSDGVSGKASVQSAVGEVEAHGSTEGVGASVKTQGGTKVGVDMGKGVKAQLSVGDFVTVTGSVQPEGEGKVSWSAQVTIGTLGNVITAEDVAKVMEGAQTTFSQSGAALLRNPGISSFADNEHALKKAVSDVVEKAQKSAAQAKSGWSLGVGVKSDDKSGGVSGTVTLTWVF